MTESPVRERNDPAQYDDLVGQWWEPRGAFAMLHWIAKARAQHLPPVAGAAVGGAAVGGAAVGGTAVGAGAPLVLDVACGGGLMAPHLQGFRHIGVDLQHAGLGVARSHGVTPVQGDATRLPFADGVFDVVVAGEVLEHVPDAMGAVAEACRVLKPGGTLIMDTIADTWWGRFSSVTVAERIPAGPPPRLHDPALFVDRDRLVSTAAAHGVALSLIGLRPAALDYVRWLLGRREEVRMLPTRSTAGLFQAVGRKA